MDVRRLGGAALAFTGSLLLYSLFFSAGDDPRVALAGGRADDAPSIKCPPKQRSPFPTSRKAAVLVEPVAHTLLVPAVDSAVAHLPWDWKILLFVPDAVAAEVATKPMLKDLLAIGKIRTMPNIYGTQADALLNATFWRALDADHVLAFGAGTAMCMAANRTADDFLDYDYVDAACGSPAPPDEAAAFASAPGPVLPGSTNRAPRSAFASIIPNLLPRSNLTDSARTSRILLLSRSATLSALSSLAPPDPASAKGDPSTYLCRALTSSGSRVASPQLAASLAVGPVWHPSPFAVDSSHRTLALHPERLDALYEECPEAVLLADWEVEAAACTSGDMAALDYLEVDKFCAGG